MAEARDSRLALEDELRRERANVDALKEDAFAAAQEAQRAALAAAAGLITLKDELIQARAREMVLETEAIAAAQAQRTALAALRAEGEATLAASRALAHENDLVRRTELHAHHDGSRERRVVARRLEREARNTARDVSTINGGPELLISVDAAVRALGLEADSVVVEPTASAGIVDSSTDDAVSGFMSPIRNATHHSSPGASAARRALLLASPVIEDAAAVAMEAAQRLSETVDRNAASFAASVGAAERAAQSVRNAQSAHSATLARAVAEAAGEAGAAAEATARRAAANRAAKETTAIAAGAAGKLAQQLVSRAIRCGRDTLKWASARAEVDDLTLRAYVIYTMSCSCVITSYAYAPPAPLPLLSFLFCYQCTGTSRKSANVRPARRIPRLSPPSGDELLQQNSPLRWR